MGYLDQGPLLLLAYEYVNDLPNTESFTVQMFVDDYLMYREIRDRTTSDLSN